MTNSMNSAEVRHDISLAELADQLNIPAYRLRLWEDIYPFFCSHHGPDGQRYYTPQDETIIRRIAVLLYDENCKSHEIAARLQAEKLAVASAAPDVPVQQERLTALMAENTALRTECESLRQTQHALKHESELVQRELSGALALLGQENARLLGEDNQAEAVIQELEDELAALRESQRGEERQKAETTVGASRHAEAEVARLRTGLQDVLAELEILRGYLSH